MKLYLSHKISGDGKTTSFTEQQKNCDKAILIANMICNALPSVEVYVPGGQTERFVRIALIKKYLTVEQVLDIDCTIIDGCDGVIIYLPQSDTLQGGCLVEYDHAVVTHKPVWLFSNVEIIINQLAEFILRA